MSEPQKHTGDPSIFSATVKGEKVENFEESLQDVTDQEVVEEAVVETAEAEVVAAPEPSEGESEEDRLVREVTEQLGKKAREQAQPQPAVQPEVAHMEGRIQELKDQITQMGRAQSEPEPEGGFDFSLLESPEVLAQFEAARDDPAAQARMFGVIAQKVLEANQGQDKVDALKQELDGLKQANQQEVQKQQNRQMFEAGVEAVKGLGGVPAALAKQFEASHELDHWNAHIAQHGPTLQGYQPKSILGLFLMEKPHFAATPDLMQAGAMYLASQIGSSGSTEAANISTTGTAAPTRGGSPETGAEVTPEEGIQNAIMAAANSKKARAKAFGMRE